MKLWLLRPKEDLPKSDNPWEPWYDKCFGCVVRAENMERAREITQKENGHDLKDDAWINPKYSNCIELTKDGPEEEIISDIASA